MHRSMTHSVSLPASRGLAEAVRPGLWHRVAAAAHSLLRVAVGKPAIRALAKIRARHAALGFPFRPAPAPAPVKPDCDCDCVPMQWL